MEHLNGSNRVDLYKKLCKILNFLIEIGVKTTRKIARIWGYEILYREILRNTRFYTAKKSSVKIGIRYFVPRENVPREKKHEKIYHEKKTRENVQTQTGQVNIEVSMFMYLPCLIIKNEYLHLLYYILIIKKHTLLCLRTFPCIPIFLSYSNDSSF